MRLPDTEPEQHDARALRRRLALEALGAKAEIADELLAFDPPPAPVTGPVSLPLADEPQVEAWRRYAAEIERHGVIRALSEPLPQLSFPIRRGISGEAAYRAATLRGEGRPERGEPGLRLDHPESIELRIHPSLGGRIPILSVTDRRDFVRLAQALAHRNEPVPIPDSMGACFTTGLVDRDRLQRHRQRWEANRSFLDRWEDEIRRMQACKHLYQDRLILLSTGPYSNVPASAVGLSPAEWDERSSRLRLEHECAHYLRLRLLGSVRSHAVDELVADFAGLTAAFGRYRADLALRFFGLAAEPTSQGGGRLANYLTDRPLTPRATVLLHRLLLAAIDNLERLDALRPGGLAAWPRLLGWSLTELAAPLAADQLAP